MDRYKVKIDEDAFADIIEITDWYNKRVKNLGARFQKSAKLQINRLKFTAYSHPIKYLNVRCMVSEKFPFLIHYRIDELNKIVIVLAVIHTSRSPDIWEERANDI